MGRVETRAALDKEGESILYEGANLSQLTLLFKCDIKTLKARTYGIKPVGMRKGVEVFDIAEIATRMGKLSEAQIDKAMARMNHDALPKQLTKEYWAGKRSKQEFMLREGDLWPTTKVVSEVGEMVKSLKMELDLLIDGIERSVEMTDKQREVAKSLVNGAKGNMLQRLREKFETKQPGIVKSAPAVDDDDEL